MPEAYIRGNTIKYLRVPDEVLDKAKEADFRRDGERGRAGQLSRWEAGQQPEPGAGAGMTDDGLRRL